MSIRTFTLLATSAAIAITSPALAQDDRYDALNEASEGVYEGEWDGAWEDAETWNGIWHGTYTDASGQTIQGEYRGTFVGEGQFVSEDGHALYRDGDLGWREGEAEADYGLEARPMANALHPRLGYTMAQREGWLADCRALYIGDNYGFDERDGEDDGGIIGGLLGAIVGGIAGNRIADGERLAGTLIGAGVGGLAGLAIGTAVGALGDDDSDDYRAEYANNAADYCEAYLRRYESGAHSAGYNVQAQPIMLMRVVPAPVRYREVVREEWVDVVVEEPSRPARRAISRPAPSQATKLIPVK